jgi:hypothetical protein
MDAAGGRVYEFCTIAPQSFGLRWLRESCAPAAAEARLEDRPILSGFPILLARFRWFR